MRDGINIQDTCVLVDGKKAEVVGFWITEENYIYVKIKREDDRFINYRLAKLDDCFKIIRKENEIRQDIRELSE
jgi:hypothetical protein